MQILNLKVIAMSESFVKFYLDTEIVPYSIVDAETGDAYPIEDDI